jgi:predicted enzyme related to lactoylglutathione lyase
MKRPVHFEILAEDPAKLATFYGSVFGWEIADWGGGEQTYWLATNGSDTGPGINGAFMGRELDQAVINTLEVHSLAEATSTIEAAGGKVVHGPNEVPGVGTHAYFADPEGILFGVMESSS